MKVNNKLLDDLAELVRTAVQNEEVSPQDAVRTIIHFLEEAAFEAEDEM